MSSKPLSFICILWMSTSSFLHSVRPLQFRRAVWWMTTLQAAPFSFSFCWGADAPQCSRGTIVTEKQFDHSFICEFSSNIWKLPVTLIRVIPLCSIALHTVAFSQAQQQTEQLPYQRACFRRCGHGKYTLHCFCGSMSVLWSHELIWVLMLAVKYSTVMQQLV